jgi:hypothetical protein
MRITADMSKLKSVFQFSQGATPHFVGLMWLELENGFGKPIIIDGQPSQDTMSKIAYTYIGYHGNRKANEYPLAVNNNGSESTVNCQTFGGDKCAEWLKKIGTFVTFACSEIKEADGGNYGACVSNKLDYDDLPSLDGTDPQIILYSAGPNATGARITFDASQGTTDVDKLVATGGDALSGIDWVIAMDVMKAKADSLATILKFADLLLGETEEKCKAAGGVWRSVDGKNTCIDTEAECAAAKGVWTYAIQAWRCVLSEEEKDDPTKNDKLYVSNALGEKPIEGSTETGIGAGAGGGAKATSGGGCSMTPAAPTSLAHMFFPLLALLILWGRSSVRK